VLWQRTAGGVTRVVYSARPDGRDPVPLARGSNPTWLPSGNRFVYVTEDQGIAIGDLAGRTTPLVRTDPLPAAVGHIAVDDLGLRAAARTRRLTPAEGPWLELYDLRSRQHVRSLRLQGHLGGRVDFDGHRRAFQVPTLQGGRQILVELSSVGDLRPVAHTPGLDILGATRVDGGVVFAAARAGGNGGPVWDLRFLPDRPAPPAP
jgi:hypothetical protein